MTPVPMPAGQTRLWLYRAILTAAVGLAYHNCFDGAFLFDDLPGIVHHPLVRDLGGMVRALQHSLRPVTDLTLALNFAVTGSGVSGFHAFNLAVHAAAALVLFELVRITLATSRLREWAGDGVGFAFAVALVWAVHPLQTQSVTYIIQRAQALGGLFTLLTLYALARGATAERGGWWNALAVLSSALAMGSKQDAVVTPVLAVLYDRVFLSSSWRRVAARWAVHLPLFATCFLLTASILFAARGTDAAAPPAPSPAASAPEVMGRAVEGAAARTPTAGFASKGATWWQYALTQSEVILHYLRLAAWPRPLSLDYYDWPVARGVGEVAPAVAAIAALLTATVVLLWRQPALGFAAAWFFITLAPTSSVMPIDDVVMEHRMYLPLAGVTCLAVAAVGEGLRRLPAAPRRFVGPLLLGGVSVAFVVLTFERNADYRSPEALWQSVVVARPLNGRAHHDLGTYLARGGRPAEAIPHFEIATRLKPSPYTSALLARALIECGRHAEAIPHYRAALASASQRRHQHLESELPVHKVYFNLGKLMIEYGQNPDEAVAFCREAVTLYPSVAELHLNLSRPLVELGRWEEASDALETAVRLAPDATLAHNNWGLVLVQVGRLDDAAEQFEAAVRTNPNFAPGYNNWGAAVMRQGRLTAAIAVFRRGASCQPADPRTLYSLAHALRADGKEKESADWYRQGLRAAPSWPEAAAVAAWELATNPRSERRDSWEAVRLAEQAVQATDEKQVIPLDALAAALAAHGRFDAAVTTAEKAVRACPPAASQLAAAIRTRLELYRQQRPYTQPLPHAPLGSR